MNNLVAFDYTSLDVNKQAFVQEKAQAIHTRLKRTAEDIIAIGQDLIEVKERLQHGQFETWLQSEFEMSDRHARRFMQVAERFGKTDKMSDFPVSILYELAAPSTPDTIIELVKTKQIAATLPSVRMAKQALRQTTRNKTEPDIEEDEDEDFELAFPTQPASPAISLLDKINALTTKTEEDDFKPEPLPMSLLDKIRMKTQETNHLEPAPMIVESSILNGSTSYPSIETKSEDEYETIVLQIRKSLLAKIDASGKSRREYIEMLLEQ